MRILTVLLLVISLLTACGGGAKPGSNEGIQTRLTPAAIEDTAAGTEIFRAALPQDGSFIPTRVPAISSLSQDGAGYHDASNDVSKAGFLATFTPNGQSEFAIWRFPGTPQDSIGLVNVAITTADPGSHYWIGIADYSSGRWEWLGSEGDGSSFSTPLVGNPGQHSSPAGFVYVAVLADEDPVFSVESVSIDYLNRYDVSGVVLDMEDNPVAGALVTTNLLDPQAVLTEPDGSFTLNAIPNGNWTLMASISGYEFFPAAQNFTVADADLAGIELRCSPKTSGFVETDAFEPNDFQENRYDFGAGPLLDATLSILDDEIDCYAFSIPAEGWYYVQYVGDDGILFPGLQLFVDPNKDATYSNDVLYGANWIGYYFQRSGEYIVKVDCQGGGGSYSLSIHSGQPQEMLVYLGDGGGPGDGDDGLYEELYTTTMTVEVDGVTSTMATEGTGSIYHRHIPPFEAVITPLDPQYVFSPLSTTHDFSTGPLNYDFNMQGTAPTDTMEPNDDKANATPLSLPLAAPVEGWIGGYDLTNGDDYDYFSFEVPGGQHLMARLRFPEHTPRDFYSSGQIRLRDAADSNITLDKFGVTGMQARSRNPLDAGTYYLEVFMEGTLMPYELDVASYDPVYLSANYMLDGKPLDDAELAVQIEVGGYTDIDSAGADGIASIDIAFMPGERVFVNHQRHGTDFNPAYEWVQFSNSDIQLTPTASIGKDSHEPNDDLLGAASVDWPDEFEATISSDYDLYDNYLLALDDAYPLAISIQSDSQDITYRTRIYDSPAFSLLYSHEEQGSHSFYFDADAAGDYIVQVAVSGQGESTYSLSLDKAGFPVHNISGSLDHGVMNEGYSYMHVVNHTTGYAVDAFTNGYDLGYYPDGNYEIEWQIANRSVVPAGKVPVVVSGSDVVQDFTASFSDNDSLEPNDNAIAAAVISLPFSVSATLDGDDDNKPMGRDSSDYHKYVADTDGLLQVVVTPWENSPVNFSLLIAEQFWSSTVNKGKRDTPNGAQMARWPVTNGQTYYIIVSGGEDLAYTIEAELIP
ncbi:MAG: carboxypeptidase regulatory-like domain-containing protein [Planctomycetales bacterium]|nr:carboxypeptidase regulatory-like domain-containing protein [bacterium]UNM09674.1 MAG: carboxypeptidase regulatory-like domain-containing protein [Planctomycetales bacterium]